MTPPPPTHTQRLIAGHPLGTSPLQKGALAAKKHQEGFGAPLPLKDAGIGQPAIRTPTTVPTSSRAAARLDFPSNTKTKLACFYK